MFEKEAQRSFDELDDRGIGDDWSIEESYINGFSNGAEFGYNKANEWHYMKNEKPKDNEYVLIYTDLNNCYVATKVKEHFMSKGWGGLFL